MAVRSIAWYLAGGKEGFFFSSAAEAGWTRRADRLLGRREAVRLVRRWLPSCVARR